MFIGCHISIAGGIEKAPQRAFDLGCETMQIFSRSPRGGKAPELTIEKIVKFKEELKKNKVNSFYIHTPYYINFASENNRIRYGSASVVKEEIERADLLGAKFVMTHLGTSKDLERLKSLEKIASLLQKNLKEYNGRSGLLLENSAGAGEIIGDSLKELNWIIEKVNLPVLPGICLDTQHSFASDYDWRNFDETIRKIKNEMDISRIKLIHANDSLTRCGSKKDRHAHIGKGEIGEKAFRNIVSFAKENNIDMILETDYDEVEKDISLLKKMRDLK